MQNGFSVIAVSALDTPDVSTSGRLLVTAIGTGGNTGASWYTYPQTLVPFPPAEGVRVTHRREWGSAPFLAEGIPATLTVRGAGGAPSVWALDPVGGRRTAVPVQQVDGGIRFDIGPAYRTLWYEIERAGATANSR
jgi:hypothetical protein